MSILLLFQTHGYLTLSDVVDALSKGLTHSISDKWSLCKQVHGALLSLTAARHALLTSSKVRGEAHTRPRVYTAHTRSCIFQIMSCARG
jgi:hypothetical protein